ncbi:MAG: hypothetical protein IPM37_22670 [Hahellaceae bacterium]|nr:hypothetical protein [Hahellaceae bacterium]
MVEGIIKKHFGQYDHFEMNNIPKEIGTRIYLEWRDVSANLKTAGEGEYQMLLNLDDVYRFNMARRVGEDLEAIRQLLNDLSAAFERFYAAEDWVCILGV